MDNEFKNLCSVAEKQLAAILAEVEELERKYAAVPIFGNPKPYVKIVPDDLYSDIMEPFEKLKTTLAVGISAAHTGATFDEK